MSAIIKFETARIHILNAVFAAVAVAVAVAVIPRARMGSESIAHEAEGRMGYGLRGHECVRNNCFSKIQLVGKK